MINQNEDCPNAPVYPFFLVSVLPDLYSVNHKASDDSWSPMQYFQYTLRALMISILIWNGTALYCPPSSQANNVNALYTLLSVYHSITSTMMIVIKSSNLLTLLLPPPPIPKALSLLVQVRLYIPNLNSIDYS